MALAESDVRWVTEPKMNLLERLYFPAIVAGPEFKFQIRFGIAF